MALPFDIAGGSIIGRDHRQVPKNCQDGYAILERTSCIVGVVTDGCGSASHSEVGAKLGAKLLSECIAEEVAYRDSHDVNWHRVQQHLLASIDVLARQMGGSYRKSIEDYFLFTVVGVLLTEDIATFFALGDGVIIINGELHELGPFEGNRPPYIGYGLLGDAVDINPEDLKLGVFAQLPLTELDSFLIGCDGVVDLVATEGKLMPGLATDVGNISTFWEEDRYFRNTELVSRQLKLIGRDWPKVNPEPGLLPDDTTLISGRRKPD